MATGSANVVLASDVTPEKLPDFLAYHDAFALAPKFHGVESMQHSEIRRMEKPTHAA